jgi:hypothetical protein
MRQVCSRFRLAVVQADGPDVAFQPFQAQIQHFLRRVRHRKQPAGGLVDPHIGGLGRQQHGGQQLEHVGVFQLGDGMRVGRLEGGEEGLDLRGFHGAQCKAGQRVTGV